ncbi:MAG: hypothetical protein GY810_06700 [Aureispira sp.]|nr:hypothetical protein [Aureispira sp.]
MRLLTLLSAILFLSSCQNAFEYREDRLIGSWEFDDATEEENRTYTTRFSIMGDYRNDQIEFMSDGTLVYQESSGGGSILHGIWSMTSVSTASDDGQNTDYVLTMSMQDSLNQLQQYTWEINLLTYDRLQCRTETQDYIYCYELLKL